LPNFLRGSARKIALTNRKLSQSRNDSSEFDMTRLVRCVGFCGCLLLGGAPAGKTVPGTMTSVDKRK
jgi:hypothetical protein